MLGYVRGFSSIVTCEAAVYRPFVSIEIKISSKNDDWYLNEDDEFRNGANWTSGTAYGAVIASNLLLKIPSW